MVLPLSLGYETIDSLGNDIWSIGNHHSRTAETSVLSEYPNDVWASQEFSLKQLAIRVT